MHLPSTPRRLRLPFAAAMVSASMATILAAPADGAVTYRNKTCGSHGASPWPGSFTLARPAGVAAGDILILSVHEGGAYADNNSYAGFTELSSNGVDKTYYKVAGSSEPSSYTVISYWSGTGTTTASLTAFAGADPDEPFDGPPVQTTSGTAASVALPSAPVSAAGSMRYSAVMSSSAVSTTFSTGLTEACDTSGGGGAAASAYEAVGAGTTAARTANRTGTGGNTAQTVILQPASVCGGGSLGLTPPSTVSFPSTAINGHDQTKSASLTATVNDMRSAAAGWNLTLTSTAFKNGGHSFKNDATTLTQITPTAGAGNCRMPVNSIGLPLTIPAAATAPTAVKIFNSSASNGRGPVDLRLDTDLSIPGDAWTGTYASTWTFSLVSGP